MYVVILLGQMLLLMLFVIIPITAIPRKPVKSEVTLCQTLFKRIE